MRSFATLGGNTDARSSGRRGFYDLTVRQEPDEVPRTQQLYHPAPQPNPNLRIRILMPQADLEVPETEPTPEASLSQVDLDMPEVEASKFPGYPSSVKKKELLLSELKEKEFIQGSDGKNRKLIALDYLYPFNLLKIKGKNRENIECCLRNYGDLNVAIDHHAKYSSSFDVFKNSVLNFDLLCSIFAEAYISSSPNNSYEYTCISYLYKLTSFDMEEDFKVVKNSIAHTKAAIKEGFVMDWMFNRPVEIDKEDIKIFRYYEPLIDALLVLAEKKVALLKKEKKGKISINLEKQTEFERDKKIFASAERKKLKQLTSMISKGLEKIDDVKMNIRTGILSDDLIAIFDTDYNTMLGINSEFLTKIKTFQPELAAKYTKYRDAVVEIFISQMARKTERNFSKLSKLEKQRLVARLEEKYKNMPLIDVHKGLSDYFELKPAPSLNF